jgi:aryl-alcohol dehydrogenase-like predicted oxidoreductase
MKKVELGRSGLSISRVVFGSMGFGPSGGDAAARVQTMRAAIDAGMTSIDTAPLYGFGRVESLVGEAIAGRRDEVQVLTKVGISWEAPHGRVLFEFNDEHGQRRAARKNSRPEAVRAEVDRSLQRLRVDVLDLVQVHHPDPDTPIPETMGALLELKKAGKLRAIGVSNYDAEQMRVAQTALGDTPLASNQVRYSLVERWPEREILPFARVTDVSVLAYSPLAQGLLGGDHHRRGSVPTDGRGQAAQWQKENLERVGGVIDGVLGPLGAAHGCSVAELSLSFLLAQPGLAAVIVGASSPAQARRNAGATAHALNDAELASIRSAFEALHLDPNAGQDLASRVQARAKRAAGKLQRVLRRLGTYV